MTHPRLLPAQFGIARHPEPAAGALQGSHTAQSIIVAQPALTASRPTPHDSATAATTSTSPPTQAPLSVSLSVCLSPLRWRWSICLRWRGSFSSTRTIVARPRAGRRRPLPERARLAARAQNIGQPTRGCHRSSAVITCSPTPHGRVRSVEQSNLDPGHRSSRPPRTHHRNHPSN